MMTNHTCMKISTQKHRAFYIPGGMFPLLFFLSGCLFTFNVNPKLDRVAFENNPPIRIAVLPFINKTDKRGAAELARASFYDSFVSLNYQDVELGVVDETLAQMAIANGKNPLETSPDIIAAKLKADALFYGTVDNVTKSYLILYAHQKVRVSVRLYDARRRAVIFSDTVTAYNRTIAPADSIIGILSSIVQTLWHMNKSENLATYERLAHRMIEDFPDIVLSKLNCPQFIQKIKVDTPAHVLKKGDRVVVTMTATSGKTATFDIGNLRHHIPMREIKSGTYQGLYEVQSGDRLDYAIVNASVTDGKFTDQKVDIKDVFRIDTIPPVTPAIINIRSSKKDFHIYLTPPRDEDFDHFILYKSTNTQKGFLEFGKSEEPEFTDSDIQPGFTYYFYAVSVDRLGNKSPASKEFVFCAPSPPPGKIELRTSGNITLYAYSSPYYINKPLTIQNGATLFIEPGTELHFARGVSLVIEGLLTAIGDEDARIIFTGEEGWGGIRIHPGAPDARFRISNAIIENASTGIRLDAGSLEGQNLEITNCSTGLFAAKDSSLNIADSIFKYNNTAINIEARQTIVKNCDFIKNNIMTELNGLQRRQEESKVRNFSYFKSQ